MSVILEQNVFLFVFFCVMFGMYIMFQNVFILVCVLLCYVRYVYNWGEHERAPHRRPKHVKICMYMYVCMYLCV